QRARDWREVVHQSQDRRHLQAADQRKTWACTPQRLRRLRTQDRTARGLGRASKRMRKAGLPISELLRQLESFYGKQEPGWPTDPYLFLVWWHCGYPASDAACAKGWESLNKLIGVELQEILTAPTPTLAAALKPGGM